MKLLKFDSYDKYVSAQEKRNRNKIQMIAASMRELNVVSDIVKKEIENPKNGLCQGVRNGFEVEYLRNRTELDVIGTEISSTANQFEHVIQWDFHDLKDEWIGKFDFIYSNSWDHSYDPDKMLMNWMKCLNDGGLCFLQWTDTHSEQAVGGADCFGLSLNEMIEWISGNYKVKKVIPFFEHSVLNPTRWWVNFTRNPRPGLRGRRINIVVIASR